TMQTARATAVWPWISTVARLGLAAVFLIAGGLHVGDLAASGRAVNAYQLMSYDNARVGGAIQPFLEIAVGLLLLVGLAARRGGAAPGGGGALGAFGVAVLLPGRVGAGARGLQSGGGCLKRGGELAAGRRAQSLPEFRGAVGFLFPPGFVLVNPPPRLSVDGL